MALHPNFPDDPHAILDPSIRWFPADEALRTTSFEKLLPPLVPTLRNEVKAWRDGGYDGAAETSKSLLRWWIAEQHLMPKSDGTAEEFRYFFAQREALETIIYLYDVIGAKDKFDLMRFDSSGAVSAGMFDETWRRFVVKMATGSGKTKVLSLVLAWSFFSQAVRAGLDAGAELRRLVVHANRPSRENSVEIERQVIHGRSASRRKNTEPRDREMIVNVVAKSLPRPLAERHDSCKIDSSVFSVLCVSILQTQRHRGTEKAQAGIVSDEQTDIRTRLG